MVLGICHDYRHLPTPPVPGLARSPFPVAVPSVAPAATAAPWAAARALPAPPAAPGATEHLVKSDKGPVMGTK